MFTTSGTGHFNLTVNDRLLLQTVDIARPTAMPLIFPTLPQIKSWNTPQVISWLRVNSLKPYVSTFNRHRVTGTDLLQGNYPTPSRVTADDKQRFQASLVQLMRNTGDLFDSDAFASHSEHILALQAALIKMNALIEDFLQDSDSTSEEEQA